jgi:hypothetical protein
MKEEQTSFMFITPNWEQEARDVKVSTEDRIENGD